MARSPFWSTLYRNLLKRRSVEAELDSEVETYFEMLVERYTAQGLSIEEARRAVRLKFEGPEQVKERVREARMGAFIDTTLRIGVMPSRRCARDQRSPSRQFSLSRS